ncbi:MAG: hypothetical protein HKN54_06965 [Flavobacteriaceae bacterium]|nr:hypothetical protein [Flavobacteriaceae bacterium]
MTQEKKYHTFDSMSEGEADYDHSKWLGSVFYYLINFGRTPYKHFTLKKYSRRNLWTGYFLKLGIIALLIYLSWIWFGA